MILSVFYPKNKFTPAYIFFIFFTAVVGLWDTTVYAQHTSPLTGDFFIRLNPSDAKINEKTVKIVLRDDASETKYITLKDGVEERVADDAERYPDAEFRIHIPETGKYVINTHVLRTEEIKRGEPVKTRLVKIQIDNQRITRRIVSDIHEYSDHSLGRFQLSGSNCQLKIWLPEGIFLSYIEIKKYIPVAIPHEAANYIPRIIPPPNRPRLWVNSTSLPSVRERLTKGENRKVWSTVEEDARKPFLFEMNPRKEIFHDPLVEYAIQIKAFYYLMTGNRKIGTEAVRLIRDYLSVLNFGNVKSGDVTRKVGSAIYTAALVYDWCYSLINDKVRNSLYSDMMRLAGDMEIGWPPFKESVVNGHANEAQVNRDLLAMGIAVYDEDPEPYRYTSYLILEELVPMKAFEYQSPRHSQGVDYGAYRHGWEMHAAWLFYRMSGTRVFDKNIESLPKYWLYMRLPYGDMLRDGDVFSKDGYYWKMPETTLLDYSYGNNPLGKAEFERQGGLPQNPLLFLLLNDPDLKAESSLDSLPLTLNCGPVLGGLIVRTGWNMGESGNNDVVAEIKGGGYHFGNHQHSDAGAFQLYYRGRQIGDLGIYFGYGTPYDFNFNKRSISHSMMLVKDMNEKIPFRATFNDGGTKFNQRTPKSPQETISDPWFGNGTILSADFGPSKQKPVYSYFKMDLTGAYTGKVGNYVRKFCFLNLEKDDIPAAIILADDIQTSDDHFPTFWKINTFEEPIRTGTNIVLHNEKNGVVGKTHVNMLLPLPDEREIEICGINDSSALWHQYHISSSLPESSGYQIIAYQKKMEKNHRFLTVFQTVAGDAHPFAVKFSESDHKYFISISDRLVCMNAGEGLIQTSFVVDIPDNVIRKILLTDLKPGFWNVSNAEKTVNFKIKVESGKNTIQFEADKDKYFLQYATDVIFKKNTF